MEGLPCEFCEIDCNIIFMSHCNKLNTYLRLREIDKNDG
jgi:hypothetical protein